MPVTHMHPHAATPAQAGTAYLHAAGKQSVHHRLQRQRTHRLLQQRQALVQRCAPHLATVIDAEHTRGARTEKDILATTLISTAAVFAVIAIDYPTGWA